jgi:ribonuclease HI
VVNWFIFFMLDPHAMHIYTDGSCFENPGGRSGCAARAEFPDHLGRDEELLFSLGYVSSTNNRMELLACIHSLRWICESGSWSGVARVQIVTDSLYVKNGVIYAREWKKDGGSNRHGEPMENWDLWKDLRRVQTQARIRVDFVWMHDKDSPILRRVHHDAKAAAKRGGTNIDSGYEPGWVTRSKVKGSATRFCATGQSAMVRPYRKKKMKNGEWKIRFDVITEDGRGYAGSCYAYASTQLTLAELHSQNGYRVRFNDNPKHPQIVELLEKVELPDAKKPKDVTR